MCLKLIPASLVISTNRTSGTARHVERLGHDRRPGTCGECTAGRSGRAAAHDRRRSGPSRCPRRPVAGPIAIPRLTSRCFQDGALFVLPSGDLAGGRFDAGGTRSVKGMDHDRLGVLVGRGVILAGDADGSPFGGLVGLVHRLEGLWSSRGPGQRDPDLRIGLGLEGGAERLDDLVERVEPGGEFLARPAGTTATIGPGLEPALRSMIGRSLGIDRLPWSGRRIDSIGSAFTVAAEAAASGRRRSPARHRPGPGRGGRRRSPSRSRSSAGRSHGLPEEISPSVGS